ncbi:hypothetical protein CPAR01_00497 [Colletotrichum paranaense]|uniref:Uncharacterized protein n=1 Tax=Colletotrichum paranaense TaxID=1914294 RepID=A0ABQ9T4I9_9PEZI|nr:uncharacterized protein CPAR01_00497 [Colletotrichum paranaense]KAI3529169.1 hypothetical protein CSPX01_15723 [Colletotrichum filicis]KAK1546530.1 hypothetical protein CPAR01_00497 [Colletotrichum paranaense]
MLSSFTFGEVRRHRVTNSKSRLFPVSAGRDV